MWPKSAGPEIFRLTYNFSLQVNWRKKLESGRARLSSDERAILANITNR
jgi:hypothetical protein